jgi:hypothetical protein
MELNNKLLAMVVMALGIFLTVVSLRLSSVIESIPECMQKRSLLNSNRGVLVLGLLMFSSSASYLLCKMNCTGEVNGSTSEMMYVGFNLVLGIVVMVLFSIVRHQLNACAPSLSGIDSMLVNVGIVIGVVSVLVSLFVLGKKLHANKDTLRQDMQQKMGNVREGMQQKMGNLKTGMQQKLAGIRGSSPPRFVDPFGLHDMESLVESSPVRFRDPFGFDDSDQELDPEL